MSPRAVRALPVAASPPAVAAVAVVAVLLAAVVARRVRPPRAASTILRRRLLSRTGERSAGATPVTGWPVSPPPEALDDYAELQAALLTARRARRRVPCQHPTRGALWHATAAAEQAAAVEGCRACPALDPCRTYALTASESSGVWGATTAADRRPETS